MRLRKMNKKGVTPIIAIILLMMMTVAAAGAAFFWIVRVQSTLTGGAEQHVDTVFSNIGSAVEFLDVAVTSNGTNLTFNLRNTGSIPITTDFNDTVLTLKYPNGTVICAENWDSASIDATGSDVTNGSDINVGTITYVDLWLKSAGDCDLPDGVLASGETVQYSNYFGGDAVAGGSFEK